MLTAVGQDVHCAQNGVRLESPSEVVKSVVFAFFRVLFLCFFSFLFFCFCFFSFDFFLFSFFVFFSGFVLFLFFGLSFFLCYFFLLVTYFFGPR